MPNRKAFDEKEKYDHSAHSIARREAGDLRPDVVNVEGDANIEGDAGEGFEEAAAREAHARDVVGRGAAEARRKPRAARRSG